MMTPMSSRLLQLQNPDGGWGTTEGRPSNAECTALSSLALPEDSAHAQRGLSWLLAHQRPDGSWAWTDEVEAPSWASSLGVLALASAGRDSEAVERGVEWLLDLEGRGSDWRGFLRRLLTGNRASDLDLELKGWPWAAGTFSWIEPTAWALLALKKAAAGPERRARRRILEAEKMILDRECRDGGWNHGSPRVLGVEIEAYPDTTALGMLALQGADAGPALGRGFLVLDRMVERTGSGLALSLAVLCRGAYGRDPTDLLARLALRFDQTGFLDETRVLALATLAVREPSAMRVQSDD